MSIPLDRLYHYIESVAQDIHGDNVLIYRFFPHGSKKLEDLRCIHKLRFDILEPGPVELQRDPFIDPQIFCNDQEPLNFDLYDTPFVDCLVKKNKTSLEDILPKELLRTNLRRQPANIYDKSIILHSEKQSSEVIKYQNNGFITAYYWAHALISLEWFRYAQHINLSKKQIDKKFLIYNRAWSGTREYRLKLADLLIDYNLVNQCHTSCSFVDSSITQHYNEYQFMNPLWSPTNILENFFNVNNNTSTYSADFDINDYTSTYFEVVLETIFDDPRIHLTEKTLRPIALGQPFILCSSAGSLQYLRDYGFQTFDSVFDESYDLITDPLERLTTIIELIKEISQWDQAKLQEKINLCKPIIEYNKNYFFSNNFFEIVTNELKTNLQSAIDEVKNTNTFNRFLTFAEWSADDPLHFYKKLSTDNHEVVNYFTNLHKHVKTLINK